MRVHIAGLGLMGASLAGALLEAGFAVDGSDRDPAACQELRRRGWLNASVAPEEAELLVLAMPPQAIVAELPERLAATGPNTALTDLASVKMPVLAACRGRYGAERFCAGHPLCGGEGKGYGEADAGLYRARPWILTPEDSTADFARERVERILSAVAARPLLMSAAEHDRLLARVSHLPQLLSSALVLAVGSAGLSQPLETGTFGGGFRDMTRLAASPAALWDEICRLNRGEIQGALSELRSSLERIERALAAGELAEPLAEAARLKSRWPESAGESEAPKR